MDTKYIKPFILALDSTLKSMVGSDQIIPKIPYIFDKKTRFLMEVSGFIGIAGNLIGLIALSMHEMVAKKLTFTIKETNVKDINNKVIVKTMEELLNTIVENAKKELKDFKIALSPPLIITKHEHTVEWMPSIPVIAIPFHASYGELSLYINIKSIFI